jgi:DNA polymerase III epsilon subunit family exonuclease
MAVVRAVHLHDLTYAVVDVETTGLSARLGDRICEVAVVVAQHGQIVDRLQTLVNPQRPISRGATLVNGITDYMVRGAPTFGRIAPSLLKALEGAVLVAHNASFDLSFLSAELRAAGYAPPANHVIDTLGLARKCYTFRSNRLGDVARALGIETRGLHRALADATLTWHVLERFMEDLRPDGVTTLDALLRLQGSLTPLSGWFTAPPLMEWDGTGEECPIMDLHPVIESALRSRIALRIRYMGHDGHESERVVEPLKVTLREQATYLVAYCRLKHEERTFRVDRIVELMVESALGT